MALTIKERVEASRSGEYPQLITKLESGWVIMNDVQPIEGYCILISDPIVKSLNDLPEEKRLVYCRDMLRVGDAIMKVTGAYHVNYETWCNLDRSLHTHIVPRYLNEPETQRVLPACKAYDFSLARKFNASVDSKFIAAMNAIF